MTVTDRTYPDFDGWQIEVKFSHYELKMAQAAERTATLTDRDRIILLAYKLMVDQR